MWKELAHKVYLIGPRVVVSLVIFFCFWIVSFLLQRFVRQIGKRTALNSTVSNMMERTAKPILLIIGVITALGTMGINVAGLVAGLGLMGFGLGFALRDVLSNLIAGALILMYRPFRRNERISVSGLEGTVVEIDLRYTTLHAEDKRILIPNSTLFTNPITVETKQD